ncbi:hypothetical protein HY229_07250 [Candidatus Acetothermia bacterium]|nr:hypothetical protein [Candidatus Acetothermia bacterium]MBI3643875.1 hypothetical protein [Candidatus Acetothermia bacterium]
MINHNLAWIHAIYEYNERVRNAERNWRIAQARFEVAPRMQLGIAHTWISKLQMIWQPIAGSKKQTSLKEMQECCD